ncbi:MAG: DUF3631 domain-containing protein, partial [Solirubrobacterales bacterium]|nr:DUF3631 domain-containing protein [Solirubrobacterales bacterium]
GGDWPERARRAARSLSAGGDAVDEVSEQVALLSDVREAMGEARTISTETLLAKLNALDESPWGAKRRGEGLDARGLAKMLRPFNIRPKAVRVGGATPKGYHASQFADAFARHLQNGQQGQQGQHPRPDGTGDVAHVSHVALFEGGDVPLATEEQEALFERHRDAGATS